ncbi:MAG: hypothetical protein ACRD38_09980 [Nitrososphaerales archaeon]
MKLDPMLMHNVTKILTLSLLLVPFVLMTDATQVLAKEPFMSLVTDNGSTNIEIQIQNAVIEDNHFIIDEPKVVTFNLRFLDPAVTENIAHINYNFITTDANGNVVHRIYEAHQHDGTGTYSLAFPDTGTYTITIDVEGAGAPPYDTSYSGTASSTIMVTPEFPLSVMAVMAAVVGITVLVTRFKNTKTL